MNVWAGILGITLIGSFIIQDSMGGEDYLYFVEGVVMQMLNDMPLQSRRHHYPLYGAPAHFTLPVSPWLDQHFPGRWIVRGSLVAWPARSPDLTPLDFFHWGCMKENVYEMGIASREELVSKINTTDGDTPARIG